MNKKHLTFNDRFYIEKRLAANAYHHEIAHELGVHLSTIRREIRRNTDPEFNGLYSARKAQYLSIKRRSAASVGKAFRQLTPEIKTHIAERLAVHTSPEVISGELRNTKEISPSKNTIYRYIQQDKDDGGALYRLLPHRGKPYKRQNTKSTRVAITDRIGIEERPSIADEKQEPGHFEIDTIFGKDQNSFLLTVVDKATKFLIIRKLSDKRAETVVDAFRDIQNNTFCEFKTIVSDNGGEFAGHKEIEKITGANFYFANPYHSWERGLNEHMNGLIRRFYPKGTDFNQVSEAEIAKLEHILNARGRKSLGYKSPNSVFMEYLMAA